MDGETYFNCCTGLAEPDWRLYRALKIGGCKTAEDGTETLGGFADDEAEFWTVYAELKDGIGECDAITDCRSRAAVDAAARALSIRSGLPIVDHQTIRLF